MNKIRKSKIYSTVKMHLILLAVCVYLSAGISCYGMEITVGPYLQNAADTSMTIIWLTSAKSTSWVKYDTTDKLSKKAFSSHDGMIDADNIIHSITIDNLKPNTVYKYQVFSKEILQFGSYKVKYGPIVSSSVYQFKTLSRDVDEISFLVLNDLHNHVEIMKRLMGLSGSRDFDMVFLNGDILENLDHESYIVSKVLQPCTELFASKVPFVYIRGNHETRGKFARILKKYLTLSHNRYYYSFDYGPVHFVIMDGGEDKADSHWAYSGLADYDRYRDMQTQWLRTEIKSNAWKKAGFRIVIMHIPPGKSEKWRGADYIYKNWRPLFNQGDLDLMICGHTHEYKMIAPQKGEYDYPMLIGGAPKKDMATVIRVDVSLNKINAVMTRDDGEVVGTYEIKK